MKVVKIAPIIAVKIPAIGGKPLATAIPKHNAEQLEIQKIRK